MTASAVLIPARLDSTRLRRKLLLSETGKPLLAHTVERALAAKEASGGGISRVVVAADDEILCEIALRLGAEAVMTRADHKSGTDRIAEAAESMDEEFIVNVQGDEPEVEPSHVLAAARLLEGTSDPMGTLAYPVTDEAAFRNPNLVKVVADGNGHALYFSRAPIPFPRRPEATEITESTEAERHGKRHGAAEPLPSVSSVAGRSPGGPREGSVEGAWGLAHMGIYVYRREFLLSYSSLPASTLERRERLEQLRALEAGERIRVAVVEPPLGAPIDTREAYDEFCRRLSSR